MFPISLVQHTVENGNYASHILGLWSHTHTTGLLLVWNMFGLWSTVAKACTKAVGFQTSDPLD